MRLDMLRPATTLSSCSVSTRASSVMRVCLGMGGCTGRLRPALLAALASMPLAALGVSGVPLAVGKSGASGSLDSLLYPCPLGTLGEAPRPQIRLASSHPSCLGPKSLTLPSSRGWTSLRRREHSSPTCMPVLARIAMIALSRGLLHASMRVRTSSGLRILSLRCSARV